MNTNTIRMQFLLMSFLLQPSIPCLHEIDKKEFHAGIIFDKDFKKLKNEFFQTFYI